MNSKFQNILEFVKSHPGSKWWVEEIVFRGRPHETDQGGIVNGGHVVLGLEYTAFDGSLTRQVTEPLPIGVLEESSSAGDIPMSLLLSDVHAAQARSISGLTDTLKARDATVTKQAGMIEDLKGVVVGCESTITVLEQKIRGLVEASAELKAELAKQVSTRDAKIKNLTEKVKVRDESIAELTAQVTALGGTELGQQLAREKRVEELKQLHAKMTAELAELTAAK
jgi:hypothetical protein